MEIETPPPMRRHAENTETIPSAYMALARAERLYEDATLKDRFFSFAESNGSSFVDYCMQQKTCGFGWFAYWISYLQHLDRHRPEIARYIVVTDDDARELACIHAEIVASRRPRERRGGEVFLYDFVNAKKFIDDLFAALAAYSSQHDVIRLAVLLELEIFDLDNPTRGPPSSMTSFLTYLQTSNWGTKTRALDAVKRYSRFDPRVRAVQLTFYESVYSYLRVLQFIERGANERIAERTRREELVETTSGKQDEPCADARNENANGDA